MAIAAMVALFSVWLIPPELIRRSPPTFPANAAAARTAAEDRTRSVVAASIAQIRGDLWTEAAVSAAAPIGFSLALTGSSAAKSETDDRPIFEHAVRWSPADSRAWLAFAAANLGGGAAELSVTELLKLSYLTGPNEIDLVPMRLVVVARGNALEDADVRQFAHHDLENVLQHAPDLRPAIVEAYRRGSPAGRQFIAAAVSEIDPAFLKTFPAAAPVSTLQPGK
jgi:hypothetical protein